MKIGILTLPFGPNFGFVLQVFATQKLLSNNGENEVVILYRGWNHTMKKSLIFRVKRWVYYNVICRRIFRFYDGLFHTAIMRSSSEVRHYCLQNNISKVVFGSDQVWRIENVRGAGLDMFGGFVNKDCNFKLYSYAASFGTDMWKGTKEETSQVSSLLSKYSLISVREDSGVDICSRYFGLEACVALDPTMMLKAEDYDELLQPPSISNKVVTYILDTTQENLQAINKVAKEHRLQIEPLYKNRNVYYKSVECWLTSIRDAKYVVVDSFHGMVFSILYHKQFAVIVNKRRGETRFVSLLSKLGLLDRLVYDIKDLSAIIDSPIDYKEVDVKLDNERKHSRDIISKILA